MLPPPSLRSIVGQEGVEKKGMTQAASSKHFEESKWYVLIYEGLLPWPARGSASCEWFKLCERGERPRDIDIDVVVLGPRVDVVVAPFPRRWRRPIVLALCATPSSGCLSSLLTCPSKQAINVPQLQPSG